jgi:galactoside O-acetyltransferase
MKTKKTAYSSLFFVTKRRLAFEQVAEFVVEFIHATGSVDDFLSTGVERMAQRANLDVEAVFFQSGFGDEFVPARAGNIDFVVIRMDVLFHVVSFRLSGHRGCTYASNKLAIIDNFCLFVKKILPLRRIRFWKNRYLSARYANLLRKRYGQQVSA